jgi:hypothetical protein
MGVFMLAKLQHIQPFCVSPMSDGGVKVVLDELNNCVRILIETAESGGRFQLLIVA